MKQLQKQTSMLISLYLRQCLSENVYDGRFPQDSARKVMSIAIYKTSDDFFSN